MVLFCSVQMVKFGWFFAQLVLEGKCYFILDLPFNLPGSGIPEPGAVPGIPGTVCSEHVYLSS